jgi:uncharacterized protein YjbI with pentapeptide repeats
MLKRWAALPRGVRWTIGGIVAVVLALAIAWVLFVPAADWLAHHDVGSATGPPLRMARDAARGRLLTLGAGLLAAGALVFTARNYILSRRTFELTEQGQVTDRYIRAIAQLGDEKLDVRIGGIYALERVARDSARDHPTVMEVLTAFIREHSREQWPLPDPGQRIADGLKWPRFKQPARRRASSRVRPVQAPLTIQPRKRSTRPDVQAALTVVGRREAKRDIRAIDLTRADLSGAILVDADLTRADLDGADLSGAILIGADLTRADLTGATLVGATLTGADLSPASLAGADLTNADLDGADLSGAILFRATLTAARWPEDKPVPEGWKLDTSTGRLAAAGTDSGPDKGKPGRRPRPPQTGRRPLRYEPSEVRPVRHRRVGARDVCRAGVLADMGQFDPGGVKVMLGALAAAAQPCAGACSASRTITARRDYVFRKVALNNSGRPSGPSNASNPQLAETAD